MANIYINFHTFVELFNKFKTNRYKRMLKKIHKDQLGTVGLLNVEQQDILHEFMQVEVVKQTHDGFAFTDIGHTLYSAICNEKMRLGHATFSDNFN